MLQFTKLLLLFFLCSPVVALKGRRVHSRRLMTQDDSNSITLKESKEGKKTNQGKKEAKGKKCKKESGSDEDEDDVMVDDPGLDDEEVDGEDDLVVCLDLEMRGNCSALAKKVYPEVPDTADGIVGGTIHVELAAKSDDAVEKMGQALEQVALAVAGCDASMAERMLQGNNNTDATESAAGFNGVSIGSLLEISNDCVYSGMEGNCSTVESPLTVYFSGDVSDEHLNSMFYSLSDEVLAQAEDGNFDEFAEILYVGTSVGETQYGLSSSAKTRSDNSGTNVGAIVGGVIGGLALVGAAVGGFLYYKSRGAAVSPSDGREGEGFAFPKIFGRGKD